MLVLTQVASKPRTANRLKGGNMIKIETVPVHEMALDGLEKGSLWRAELFAAVYDKGVAAPKERIPVLISALGKRRKTAVIKSATAQLERQLTGQGTWAFFHEVALEVFKHGQARDIKVFAKIYVGVSGKNAAAPKEAIHGLMDALWSSYAEERVPKTDFPIASMAFFRLREQLDGAEKRAEEKAASRLKINPALSAQPLATPG